MKMPEDYVGLNKSQLIRAFKSDNPESKPKEISKAVSQMLGEEISSQYCSTVLSQAKKKADLFTGGATSSTPKSLTAKRELIVAPPFADEPQEPQEPQAMLLVIQAAGMVGISGVRKILNSLEQIRD
ncbi:MAG: hypothetical protein WDZ51_06110 [Pirellulaceae bacterium]